MSVTDVCTRETETWLRVSDHAEDCCDPSHLSDPIGPIGPMLRPIPSLQSLRESRVSNLSTGGSRWSGSLSGRLVLRQTKEITPRIFEHDAGRQGNRMAEGQRRGGTSRGLLVALNRKYISTRTGCPSSFAGVLYR